MPLLERFRRWRYRLFADRRRRRRAWLQFRRALAVWLDAEPTLLRLQLDDPAFTPGVTMRVSGVVQFRGWALASRGIDRVTFSVGSQELGKAWYGFPRTDVAAHFLQFPDALSSGYHFPLQTRILPSGTHTLTITATSKDRRTALLSLDLIVDNRESEYAQWLRLTRPGPAALAWMRRVSIAYRDPIMIGLRLCSDGDPLRLAATLCSVLNQAYPHWRLYLDDDRDLRDALVREDLQNGRIHFGPLEAQAVAFSAELMPGVLLEPHALFECVRHLRSHPELDGLEVQEDVFVPPDYRYAQATNTTGTPAFRLVRQLGNEPACKARLSQLLCSRWEAAPPVAVPAVASLEAVTLTHAPCPLLERDQIHRILVVKLDHLGDVLLALPALRRLHELFPAAEITALVGPWAQPLIEKEPFLGRILTRAFFEARSTAAALELTRAQEKEVWEELAPFGFDLAIDLRREPETRPFLRLSGARFTAGFAYEHSWPWLTLALPCETNEPRHAQRRQVGQDLLMLVETLDIACREDLVPHVVLADEELAEAQRLLSELGFASGARLIGLHPGSGRPIKCWPAQAFAELADRLSISLNAKIVLFGSAQEADLVAAVLAQMKQASQAISMAGKLGVRQLLAVLPRLALFVGNDTGPTHMAAAAGIPTLAINSGTNDPTQWVPLGPQAASIQKRVICSPCYLGQIEECPYQVRCLHELSVEEVHRAALRLLDQ